MSIEPPPLLRTELIEIVQELQIAKDELFEGVELSNPHALLVTPIHKLQDLIRRMPKGITY
tara:strand:+ start:770 stop:952 length:183 start_codon:yes stop_codon:yes gene_type:complete